MSPVIFKDELTACEKEAALQSMRLNYEETELPRDCKEAWNMMLSHPDAFIDKCILSAGIMQGDADCPMGAFGVYLNV